MVLQLLSEFAYNWVEQSWIVATVLVKYFLLGLSVKIAIKKKTELEHISNQLVDYSGELVAIIALLGFVNVFAGFEFKPMFNVFSQVVAFLYFMFLFWKY